MNLLENALDSLNEALDRFKDGDDGNVKSYKFCILHMSHFIELLFKYHIYQTHFLLIYKNPFAKRIEKEKTIGLWEAINFISNENEESISNEFRKDLEWLKKNRNDIEHYEFDIDVKEARSNIGRIFRAVLEFLNDHSELAIGDTIPESAMETFKLLSDEYEFERNEAIRKAQEIDDNDPSDPSDPDATPAVFDCGECGNPTLAREEKSKTGYRCTLCGNEEGDELPCWCDVCQVSATYGEMKYWENEMGELEGRCFYCSGQHHMLKND